MSKLQYDVVVVGAGNAALCAALSAQENGAKVLVLERAPEHKRGGNSHFTGGLVRFPYYGIDDVTELAQLSEDEANNIEVGEYTEEQFYETIARVTEYKADPELTALVVAEALPTMKWMRTKGIRFALSTGRQAFKTPEGKFKFWGGAPIEFVGGGIGLVEMLFESAEKYGLEIWYNARGMNLIQDEDKNVIGVEVKREGKDVKVYAKAVVLAAGGFESNPQWRAQYLGPNWDLAKVRGTEYNTGDGLRMAIDVGAQAYGHWSGCHAVQWDLNAPDMGDRKVGELYQKHSYPLGIVVNRDGKRFIDEGADFRNFTYAKYGREVMKQPEMRAVQIFDAKVVDKLREEYRIKEVTKAITNTIEELAEQLEINPEALAQTVKEYNAAINDNPYDPTVKDGKSTVGLELNKTNWALPLDTPPYYGFAVTCGITFTFGGVRINNDAEVVDEDGNHIQGLYAAGEMVGGLFYHNYPGGTGLSTGAVFGKVAGTSAAAFAKAQG